VCLRVGKVRYIAILLLLFLGGCLSFYVRYPEGESQKSFNSLPVYRDYDSQYLYPKGVTQSPYSGDYDSIYRYPRNIPLDRNHPNRPLDDYPVGR
jgi:hypothetical protein